MREDKGKSLSNLSKEKQISLQYENIWKLSLDLLDLCDKTYQDLEENRKKRESAK